MDDFNEDDYPEFDYYDEQNGGEEDVFLPEDDQDIFRSAYSDRERIGFFQERDIDEVPGTYVDGEKFNKFEIQNRTPEDIFRAIVNDTSRRYDISKQETNDSLRIMQKINSQNRNLKYKNPKAILFAILVFNIRGEIDKRLLERVYEEKAKNEDISKIDLLRYAFFVQEVRKN
jgi:hypothetical protein